MITVPVKTPHLVHGSTSIWTGMKPGTPTSMTYDCGAYVFGNVAPLETVITCLGCAVRRRFHGRG